MTDFYALLKQSIIERDLRDATAREAVYAQARDAIIKQLWAYQPPLAADEIDTRVGAYDTAVERIEADLQDAFANGEIPERPKPERQRSAPPPPPPPPPEPEEAMSEEDDAPPIADWNADLADVEDGVFVEDEAFAEEDADEEEETRGVPRAAAAPDGRSKARMDYDEDAAYAEPATAAAGGGAARWEGSAMAAPARPAGSRINWMGWFGRSDHERIQVLAGAIAGSFLALAVLGAYLFFARGSDEGVTLDIGVRREVSDAATAARIAAENVSVEQAYTLFDGRDPTIFVSTPDNPVRFVSEGGGYVRVSSTASSPGVKAHIGPGLAGRLAGREVRVTIIARAAPDNGALNMRFAYQSGLAISHWQTANLGADYEPVAMRWRLPAMQTGEAGDYLVIEPGIPGDGTAVDIQSIKIDVLGG
jgi:hypothetical protein